MVAHAPQDTLRRINNVLLAVYANNRGLFPDLDIMGLKQTQIEPIYQAIQELETIQREKIEYDLRNVAIMADKRRIQQLHKALKFGGHDFPATELYEKQRSSYDKSMWTFLHHPAIFDGVLKYSFPFTEQRHWYKFPYLSGHPPTIDQAARDKLSHAIGRYFREYDGRGKHCKVEHHTFQDYEYLFAYPSEYPDQVPEWDENGEFSLNPHQLAFMVIFVFKKSGNAVDIYVMEPLEVKRQLFGLWAKEILGLEKVDTKPKCVHSLTPFHTREQGIIIPPESPVESLTVYKLRFAPAHNPRADYTIQADISENRQAVYDELEKKYLNINHIKLVGLEAILQRNGTGEKTIRRFEISPRSYSLKHDDMSVILRQFLKDTGIDTTL
jgi:hypothetical protein